MSVVRPIVWLVAAVTTASVGAMAASDRRSEEGESHARPRGESDSRRRDSTPDRPARLAYEIVSRRPHDPEAFTQGLVLDGSGRLFESTGLLGRSTLREVEPLSGEVLRTRALPDEHFGEGLALVEDRLVQLTWQNGVATEWDAATFEPLRTLTYDGQGWGLCHDGTRLVMSDGSDRLTFRDPATFEPIGSVDVTVAGRPRDALNELECADGAVWANVYTTDRIVRIDPETGSVTGVLDLEGIIDPHPDDARAGAVLNGIAYDPRADTYLVTGKLWPDLMEIRILDPRDELMADATPTTGAPTSPD